MIKDNSVVTARGIHRWLSSGDSKTHVLRGVDLDLAPRKTYAIVGPSGCGKSTLLYILGLLDEPDEGYVTIGEQRVASQSDEERTRVRREKIGFIFQFHYLLSEFTALENLHLTMQRRFGRLSSEHKERAQQLLVDVGLKEKLNRRANQLSGGERQRVAVARALANTPAVVLADEPTGNLDAANSDALFSLFQELAIQRDQAFLIVTHNPDLAARCDETLTMRDGQFISK